MKKVLKLNDVKRLVQKMIHLNNFCKYTKLYQSFEGRLVIILMGKLDSESAKWVKKQKCYLKEINGITFISLNEETLPKDSIIN